MLKKLNVYSVGTINYKLSFEQNLQFAFWKVFLL